MSDMVAIPNTVRVLRQMTVSTRNERPANWHYDVARALDAVAAPFAGPWLRLRLMGAARRVDKLANRLKGLSDEDLAARIDALSPRLDRSAPLSATSLKALAVIVETSHRFTGLRPFRTQIAGALALCQNRLIEVETGSGKTLTAALAAALAGRGGETVHIITANDYLAARDRAELSEFYTALGLTTGQITTHVPLPERARQHRAQIIYACNKEIAFDYLRDRIALGAAASALRLSLEVVYDSQPRAGQVTMRGLPFAIVDEADAVLIDECRTPLILSETAEPDPDWARQAMELADALAKGRDFQVDEERRVVELTTRGQRKLEEMGEEAGGIWRNSARRDQAVQRAISARGLFHKGEHYVVDDGRVLLVDEYTGRLTQDRSLGDGLHQLVEQKEEVEITGRRLTLGRMTYQRFFRRYARVSGMTGTAREVRGEFAAVYGLPMLRLRPPKRSRRKYWRTRIFRNEAVKWAAIAKSVARLSAAGRPILIATRTVTASEDLAAVLEEKEIEFVLLNALQNAEEAETIAKAGRAGRVTLATNMAGRGVDIKLSDEARNHGGLHVILTEYHEAGRIDRQALGRCARQGDPGTCQAMLSWSDPLAQKFGGWRARLRYGGQRAFERAQARAERLHGTARRELLRQDMKRDDFLDFTGGGE